MEKGLFGKLPSHGDFIARGLTSPQRQALDRWLTQNIGQMTLPADGLRLRWALGGAPMVAAIMPSKDKAGRVFPIMAVTDDTNVNWADAAAHVLAHAIADGSDAQATFDALPLPTEPPGAPFTEALIWQKGETPMPLAAALRTLSSG